MKCEQMKHFTIYTNFVAETLWILAVIWIPSRTLADKYDIRLNLRIPGVDRYDLNFGEPTFDHLSLLKKKIRDVKVTEYMHIPKCGTLIYRNACERKGMLSCLDKTVLLNRKCGLIGEHCDWLSKYTCHMKYNRNKSKKLFFFTLLRDPVSRVRSYYTYFRKSACKSGRAKGSGWSKSLCGKVGNYTAWLLDDSNWSHNLMVRMLYGRKVSGNACRIIEEKENYFWKHELRRQQYPQNLNGNMVAVINKSPHVFEKAKRNLMEHFLLWGPQSEMEEFFCILGQLLGKRKKWRINSIIKGRKTSYSKGNSDADMYTETNNRFALALNQLDNELYQWSLQYWNMLKEEYPMCMNQLTKV